MTTHQKREARKRALGEELARRLINGETQVEVAASLGISHQYVSLIVARASLPEPMRKALDSRLLAKTRDRLEARMSMQRVNSRLNEQSMHWCSYGSHVVAISSLPERAGGKLAPPCRACRVVSQRKITARRIAAGVCCACGGKKPCRCMDEPAKLKHRARHRLRLAIKAGKLKRPGSCISCGTRGRVQGHHADYSKPLEVRWLCIRCHSLHHRDERINTKYREMSPGSEVFNPDPEDILRVWESR